MSESNELEEINLDDLPVSRDRLNEMSNEEVVDELIKHEQRQVLKTIVNNMAVRGNDTQYYWLDDEKVQYEIEVVICRIYPKNDPGTHYLINEPRGVYEIENTANKTVQ